METLRPPIPPVHRRWVNPYTGWVHNHPDRLLANPTPAELQQRREQAGEGPALHVELGSGSGNFLTQLAGLHPQDHLVGFELRYKRLVQAARKLERDGRQRAWLLREPAEAFPRYFAPQTVDHVYVLFPDPWVKVSQWRNRMVNSTLLHDIGCALKPGGLFHLKTDHSGYFLHVLGLLPGVSWGRIHGFSNHLHRSALPLGRVRSEFEAMFASRGKPVFYLALQKTGTQQADPD
ncbi:MAG: hypothetical protein OEV94_01145 [Deltaproteobacteria bacterium]|nr:hypothetical protein [Deltaproteobacteria bacterium]